MNDADLRQYTILETMAILGIKSKSTIYALVKDGKLKLNRIGKRAVRISGSSLQAFVNAVETGNYDAHRVEGQTPNLETKKSPAISSAVDRVRGWLGGTQKSQG